VLLERIWVRKSRYKNPGPEMDRSTFCSSAFIVASETDLDFVRQTSYVKGCDRQGAINWFDAEVIL
jgi:hypothetical protein